MEFTDPILSKVVETFGYVRVRSQTYRANWSTEDIEHFLYFIEYGKRKDYLMADFGIRHCAAEMFGKMCILKYGGNIYQSHFNFQSDTNCLMKFSLGNLAKWGSRWSLNIRDMGEWEFNDSILVSIRDFLIPIVRSILTIKDFHYLLGPVIN